MSRRYEPERVLSLFRELEFQSLIDRLPTVITRGASVGITRTSPADDSYLVSRHCRATGRACRGDAGRGQLRFRC